jgi:hypothetical protein
VCENSRVDRKTLNYRKYAGYKKCLPTMLLNKSHFRNGKKFIHL